MTHVAHKLYFLLLVSYSFACAKQTFVCFTGSKILEETIQGKKCKTDIFKFEEKIILEIEQERTSVAQSEQEILKLQKDFEMRIVDFDKKSKQEQQELLEQDRMLVEAQRSLALLQQQFLIHVEQAKEKIAAGFERITHNFYKDVAERSAILHGWDFVALSENKFFVIYHDRMLDATNQIITGLEKQIAARGKKYSTLAEVKQLFTDLGLIHLESNKIDSTISGKLVAQDTVYYLHNKKSLDEYLIKYGSIISKHHRAPFCVKWVGDQVGFGVFATADMKAGDFIQEYTGVIRTNRLLKGQFDDTTYTWLYPASGNHKEMLHLDSKFKGNEMRFVNHSNHPNVVQVTMIGHDNLFHVCYVAHHDIKAGEQLLVSYGKDYWTARNYYEELG